MIPSSDSRTIVPFLFVFCIIEKNGKTSKQFMGIKKKNEKQNNNNNNNKKKRDDDEKTRRNRRTGPQRKVWRIVLYARVAAERGCSVLCMQRSKKKMRLFLFLFFNFHARMHERHQKKKKKQERENEKEIRFLYAKSELTELYPVFDALSFFFFFFTFLFFMELF